MKKLKIITYFSFLCCILNCGTLTSTAQCNGYQSLCNKSYKEVLYVTTHNAFNYEGAFLLPNQNFSITQQLKDGVRAFMIDVYLLNDEPVVYHSFDALGTQTLLEVLSEFEVFLVENPNEIVTIILESYVDSDQIATAISTANLLPYMYEHDASVGWPNLQEMINTNKRLVFFSDRNDGGNIGWHLYLWDYAVETAFSNDSQADLSCAFNRGNPDNDLFILNHFVTNKLSGTGEKDSSLIINTAPFLKDRIEQCTEESGKMVNFLTVDFYDLGDVLATANEINGVTNEVLGFQEQHNSKEEIYFQYNAQNQQIEWQYFGEKERNQQKIRIVSINGNSLFAKNNFAQNTTSGQISTHHWQKGMYLITIETISGFYSKKLIVF